VRVVIRAGCYLTHDDGLYAGVSPLPALRPALELWAHVLSCPEPRLAIAGFGKRDAPYDLGLPVLRDVRGATVESMADQHAFLRDPAGALRVGDVIRCGISHPCTAFDKWRLIPGRRRRRCGDRRRADALLVGLLVTFHLKSAARHEKTH
jgi:D-serine deaminase-like pyridoxal phosphate-dependent protein